MAKLIKLKTHSNNTGKITVIEKILPFKIKRIYFIHGISGERGAHAHKKNEQAAIAIKGSCKIVVKKKNYSRVFRLKNNKQLLILKPEDWHLIKNCSKDLILLVAASQNYNPKDYIKDFKK